MGMFVDVKLSAGFRPIATCSPKNFALAKSYGAEKVFDYRSATCAQDIREYTKNTLEFIIDCITVEATMKLCYQAMGRAGGNYTALEPPPEAQHTRKAIKHDWILATATTGRSCSWPEPYGRPGDPLIRAFAEDFAVQTQVVFSEGKLKPHPARVLKGGFEGILEGVNIIRRGEVSGEKLVYQIS